jgi:hypothetical protein
MSISIVGAAVCGALLVLGSLAGSPVIIGLFAALPFGATAIGVLGASTPLIFTVFEILLAAQLAVQATFTQKLFASDWVHWMVLALALYVIAGAVLLPRLFAGQIAVPGYVDDQTVEVLLGPVQQNFNQAAYFALATAMFYGFRNLLFDPKKLFLVRRGFIVFAGVHAALGLIDLGGKLVGLSDLLQPVRTAGYLMRNSESVGGFWRITGGCSEASSFAGTAVVCLAFCITYWRATGSRGVLVIAICLLGLLLISTSTTAYVALAILAVTLAASVMHSALNDRLITRDAALAGAAAAGLMIVSIIYVAMPSLFGSFVDLIYQAVFEKSQSLSGIQRAYWNAKALEAFAQSFGIGIGMGSSRSSSWVISVLSQLGVVGFVLFALLVTFMLRGMRGLRMTTANREVFAIANSVRAAVIAELVTSSLAGSGSNPGVIFFIALAVIVTSRKHVSQQHQRTLQFRAFRFENATGLHPAAPAAFG